MYGLRESQLEVDMNSQTTTLVRGSWAIQPRAKAPGHGGPLQNYCCFASVCVCHLYSILSVLDRTKN